MLVMPFLVSLAVILMFCKDLVVVGREMLMGQTDWTMRKAACAKNEFFKAVVLNSE